MKAILNFFVRIWRFFFPKKRYYVKPTGTMSIVGKTSYGIEPVHHMQYFRRIKINKDGK